jgi:hypothetical protein
MMLRVSLGPNEAPLAYFVYRISAHRHLGGGKHAETRAAIVRLQFTSVRTSYLSLRVSRRTYTRVRPVDVYFPTPSHEQTTRASEVKRWMYRVQAPSHQGLLPEDRRSVLTRPVRRAKASLSTLPTPQHTVHLSASSCGRSRCNTYG